MFREWHDMTRRILWAGLLALGSSAGPVAAQTYLLDLGRNNGTDGRATTSPDANGRYWNNIQSPTQTTIGNRTATNLVNSTNGTSGIGVELIGLWQSNGRLNGGLFSPSGPQNVLLGDLAIETATEDFYFLTAADSSTGTVRITGLEVGRTYNVVFLGSRTSEVETRKTRFSSGGKVVSATTTGYNIGSDGTYDGNDNKLAGLYSLTPNGSGVIDIFVEVEVGAFAYINAMKIHRATTLKESLVLIDLGNTNRRHSPGAADSNGNWWNHLTNNVTVSTLTNAAGTATTLGITASGWVGPNPAGVFYNDPGGLSPDAALHGGVFAFTNVAMDALYFDTTFTPSLVLSGLSTIRRYNLIFYAGRVAAETRVTTYAVGASSVTLTNSGTGIGSDGSNWNNDKVAVLSGLAPSSVGAITVNVTRTAGTFAYLSALAVESVEQVTITNTVAMRGSDGTTVLPGTSSGGSLVQLIAVGANGNIDFPPQSSPGAPGGDDTLIPATGNPTFVGAGMALPDTGQLLRNMIYSDSLAGTAVYVRYWNATSPTTNSYFGNSAIFYLPLPGGPILMDFFPPGSGTPYTNYYIPGWTFWTLLLLAVVIAFAYGKKYFRHAPASSAPRA